MPTLRFISSHSLLRPWLLVPSNCSWQGMNGFIAQSTGLFSSLLYLVANSIADFLAFETFPLTSLIKPHSMGFPATLWADFSFFPFSAFPLIVSITLDSVLGFYSRPFLSFHRIFSSLLPQLHKDSNIWSLILSPCLWIFISECLPASLFVGLTGTQFSKCLLTFLSLFHFPR